MLERIFAADKTDEYHDNCQHEQYINKPAERVRGYDTEEPQNDKNDRDGV
jgi:hypothetical protein